ncbi:MAG TPA: hypothetical protein VFG64_04100 [Dongiaceae bacterium]|nr:hypothetical protein [Dongiaceae bacterium]
MLADTEDLVGRFVAICRIGDQWRIFNDACATRTVYFAEDRPAIASHSTILGDLTGEQPRVDLFRHYWCALPGNASPVAGVRVLPANFALDPESRRLWRYWPRAERHERPVSALLEEADWLFVRTAEATATRWKPAISVTAGLDSRLTLAVYRQMPGIVAFTYCRGPQHRVDAEVARQVCDRLGIEHRRLPPVERSEAESIYRLMESMPDCPFAPAISAIYWKAFEHDSHIHVRSNLAEIGRAFWRAHPDMPTAIDPENWVAVSLSRSTRSLPLRREAADYLRKEMTRFFATVGYDISNPYSATIRGYDVWDLVYMEHRMATWHGPALLGSDMAFDTAILFNSRRVLDLLLAAPLADRKNATLLRAILAARCPEIADIPINPRPRRTVGQLFAGACRQTMRRAKVLRSIEQRLRSRRA